MLLKRLQARCLEREAQHQTRRPVCLSHTTSADALLLSEEGSQPSRVFCSNNYLGLANHHHMIKALCEGATTYGVGSGASPLVTGYSKAHRDAERSYADFLGVEAAMLFSNGFMANLSVMQSLVGRGDVVLHDRDNHASLLDATVNARAELKRYRHGDSAHCRELLEADDNPTLLVTDTVFSMSGDQAPLNDLVTLAKKHDATLMLDDSHGFGVLGEGGLGAANEQGVSPHHVDVTMIGLGKAMGCYGGIVAGSHELIDGLRQFSRAYIYSTALPPACALAAQTAVRLLQEESWRVEQLRDLIESFTLRAKARGIDCLPSSTAIQSWVVGEEETALRMAESLKKQGFLIMPIRTPTVPKTQARLRFTLNVGQTESDIDALLLAVERARDET